MEERELRAWEVVWALQKNHRRWVELTGCHRSFSAGRIRRPSRLKEAEIDAFFTRITIIVTFIIFMMMKGERIARRSWNDRHS